MYIIPSNGPSRFCSTLIQRYPLQAFGPKLYLPNSSAGAPSFSPAYDGFWTNTANAVRVVGRLNKKYGTAFQDVTVSANAAESGTTILLRQFVIPLDKTGYLSQDFWNTSVTGPMKGFGPNLTGFGTYAKWSSTLRSANIWAVMKLVDAAGTLAANSAERTVVVTIPGASGLNMTSAGLFVPSDVNSYFTVDQKDNSLFDGAASSSTSNLITAYNNASSVTINLPYTVGCNSIGAARTIRLFNQAVKGSRVVQDVTTAITDSTSLFSYTGQQYVNAQIANKGWAGRYYYVLEIGFIPIGTSGVGRTFTVRFGDPIDDTVIEDPTNGSVGGSLTSSLPQWHILQS